MFKKSLKYAIIISLLLHLLLAVVAINIPQSVLNYFKPKTREVVEVNYIDPKKIEKTPKEKQMQFVEQDEKAVNDETDPNAKYLSRHNQVVKKQTIATNHGEFQNATDRASSQGPNQQKSIAQAQKPLRDKVTNKNGRKKTLTLNDFKPQFDYSKDAQKQAKSADVAGATGSQAKASQSLDRIKDLDPGLETLLTTKEFVFYSFYSRMRNQLNTYWTPKVREEIAQINKSGRNIASNEDKITKLLVTLDTSGRILKIQLVGDSGVRELDKAAIDAFKEAAPFPNPPKGMVDPDGTIKVLWNFVLEA